MARAVTLLTERYRKQQQILCLPPATGDLPESGIILASPACPVRKPIEHAGHIYQEKVIRAYSINGPESDSNQTSGPLLTSSELKNDSATPTRPKVDAAASLASKLAVRSDDLYELLELGDKRWHATADDIKKSFRRISLTYHPDKIAHLGEAAREASESHFKAVMKAYDVLSDKKKRAAYDSIDDVDDSIPTERDAQTSPERFYDKFGKCFALNSRWSVSDRVPQLGDDKSDMKSVDKFYEFWYSFKSWRDFSFDLEYDLDQAECREEKRWMERQNSKHVKSKKLDESARIRRLVDLAYKHDPRLQRERAATKAKKNAQKLEKRKAAEERARIEREAEERAKIEADKKAAADKEQRAVAKKQKENARQVMRKTRQKLRAAARSISLESSERALLMVEKMCMEGTVESIEALTSALSALNVNDEGYIENAVEVLERASNNPRQVFETSTSSGDPIDRSASPSNRAPIECPDKDDSNCSTGSGNLSNSVKSTSIDETESKGGAHETAWTADELSLLSKGVAKFPGGTRDRWQKLADFIGTKSADEVLGKVNEVRSAKGNVNKSKMSGNSNQAARKEDAKAFERFQEKKKGSKATNAAVPPSSKQTNPAPAVNSVPAKASQPPNKLLFTPREQSVFEAALKKFPASDGDLRWKKVSNVVGRSAEDCKTRFNELITFFQTRKQKQ